MSVLLQLLVTMAVICGFIVLRLLTERWLTRTKLRQGGAECENRKCFGDCHPEQDRQLDPVCEEKTLQRNIHHAP